eukprot:8423701-Karenia_brevis.AAC.1
MSSAFGKSTSWELGKSTLAIRCQGDGTSVARCELVSGWMAPVALSGLRSWGSLLMRMHVKGMAQVTPVASWCQGGWRVAPSAQMS